VPLSQRIRLILKRNFISGALVVAPLILTFILLRFFFETIDGVLAPMVKHVFGYSIPGLGLITTILLILLVGFFARNLVGANFLRYGEKLLTSFPGVRTIYGAAKQLVEGVTLPNKHAFKQVVLVEYPRRGSYAMAFLVNRTELQTDGSNNDGNNIDTNIPNANNFNTNSATKKDLVCIFIPSTPTPVSGMVILVPPADVTLLEMTIEEGFRFLVSGGIASPDSMKGRPYQTVYPSEGSTKKLAPETPHSHNSDVTIPSAIDSPEEQNPEKAAK
jgi:uncharacterized membrane protein